MIEVVDFLFVCARLATAQQRYGEAARRFGLAEQVAQQIGYGGRGPMRAQIAAALTTVRAALGATVFAKAFAIGGSCH
ncbi:MAG: hypothetical protein DYG89_37590 [Caldilinea sp. CFX5]|nr:hypothetical protein [Caldilinea sp. CFX5]